MFKVQKRKSLMMLIIIASVIMLSAYLYAFKLPYFIIEGKKRVDIENSIRLSPRLPDRFYEIYNIIYPRSLEQGQLGYYIDRDIKKTKERIECPCRLAVYNNHLVLQYRISLPQMVFFIEDIVSQKECLNNYANGFQFDKDITGIRDASVAFYAKEINELNDREYIELIIIMENPFLYNRVRHPEVLKEEVDKYFNKINYASKP